MKIFWSKISLAKFSKLSLALVAVLPMLWGGSAAATSTENQSITLSPTTKVVTIKPGETVFGSLQVLNQGAKDFDINLYATGYHIDNEAYDPTFTPLPGAPNVGQWIHLQTTKAKLASGGSVNIGYAVTVPPNTLAGGYYGVAFAETQGNSTNAQTGVVVHQRVGAIFYITVPGKLVNKGKILTWKTSFLQKPPLTASLRISNSGNVHFPATFQLTVKDVFGHTKFTQTTRKEVLPQTIRNIRVNWPSTPALGLVKVGGSVDYLGKTQVLPSHWVLVLSQTSRQIIILLIVLLALWLVVPPLKRRRSKKPHYRKK